jgi:hypothetical protein
MEVYNMKKLLLSGLFVLSGMSGLCAMHRRGAPAGQAMSQSPIKRVLEQGDKILEKFRGRVVKEGVDTIVNTLLNPGDHPVVHARVADAKYVDEILSKLEVEHQARHAMADEGVEVMTIEAAREAVARLQRIDHYLQQLDVQLTKKVQRIKEEYDAYGRVQSTRQEMYQYAIEQDNMLDGDEGAKKRIALAACAQLLHILCGDLEKNVSFRRQLDQAYYNSGIAGGLSFLQKALGRDEYKLIARDMKAAFRGGITDYQQMMLALFGPADAELRLRAQLEGSYKNVASQPYNAQQRQAPPSLQNVTKAIQEIADRGFELHRARWMTAYGPQRIQRIESQIREMQRGRRLDAVTERALKAQITKIKREIADAYKTILRLSIHTHNSALTSLVNDSRAYTVRQTLVPWLMATVFGGAVLLNEACNANKTYTVGGMINNVIAAMNKK